MLRVASLMVLLGTTLPIRSALADDKTSCTNAYVDAQTKRIEQRLLAAREDLRACAQPACSALMRGQMLRDCSEWLTQVEAAIPSFVISMKKRSDVDADDLTFFLDGLAQPKGTGDHAIEVDPGPHAVRVEGPSIEPAEQTIVVVEGTKDQVLEVTLSRRDRAAAATTAEAALPAEAHGTSRLSLAYGALGVGVVGLTVGSVFGVLAINTKSTLDGECRQFACPSSADSHIQALHTQTTVASVGFGVGLLGAATAVVLFALGGHSTGNSATGVNAPQQPSVTPWLAHGVAGLRGDFW